MCDFSLHASKSRPAVVGEKLVTFNFGAGTTGFRSADDLDPRATAICVLPGTEIAFDKPFKTSTSWFSKAFGKVGIFRQVHKEKPNCHHDALETPQGDIVMLTQLAEGQTATVLQLPAAPKTAKEAEDQKRLEVVG